MNKTFKLITFSLATIAGFAFAEEDAPTDLENQQHLQAGSEAGQQDEGTSAHSPATPFADG